MASSSLLTDLDAMFGQTEKPEPSTATKRHYVDGGSFLLDEPAEIPAIWGDGSDVLWPEGEPLIITGPTGVGKTTLVGQLVWARLGFKDDVLGYTVRHGSKRVLYLASDRPRQVRRALRRLATPGDRAVLDDRLRAWEGPPPRDLAADPGLLLEMCLEAEADTVVLDSLKDMAIGLANDEVGAGLNRAVQLVIANGIEVVCLHHQRKMQNGSQPKSVDDVYGSMHITAGAGSVVLLWGAAGDKVVKMIHLKQPASVVGPLDVEHDAASGTSSVHKKPDLVALVSAAPPEGLTLSQIGRLVHGREASAAESKALERDLKKLVTACDLVKDPSTKGGSGGAKPGCYRVAIPPVDPHGADPGLAPPVPLDFDSP